MQSRTGVTISSMNMRVLGTSGVCGSSKPRGSHHQSYAVYMIAKSHLDLRRQCIEQYKNSIFDQLNKAADTDFK